MTKNEDISNPFEVTERKRLAVQNNVDKNKYLTIHPCVYCRLAFSSAMSVIVSRTKVSILLLVASMRTCRHAGKVLNCESMIV